MTSAATPARDVLSQVDAEARAARVRDTSYALHISLTGGSPVYPGWIDRDRVFYFSERRVYGSTGRALALMTVRRDGTDRRCLQPWIDLIATGAESGAAATP